MISFVGSPNAVVVMVSLINLVCWGSWGILGKLAEPLDTHVFAVDFVAGQVMGGLIYCLTLGMVGPEPTFVDALVDTSPMTGMGIALGGVFCCLANVLVSKAVTLVGVSVAFPMCLGAGLVGGTTLNYMMQPENSLAEWLFPGLACAAFGTALGGVAERLAPYVPKTDEPAKSQSPPEVVGQCAQAPTVEVAVADVNVETAAADIPAAKTSFKMCMLVIAAAGSLSALFNPTASYFMVKDDVDAFTSLFYFNLGQLAGIVVVVMVSSMCGSVGSFLNMKRLMCTATRRQHALCFVAGLVNVTGMLCNFLAGSASSFTQAFGIAMCAPVFATFIGVVLGEFSGRSHMAKGFVVMMCIFYLLGITLIASSATVMS